MPTELKDNLERIKHTKEVLEKVIRKKEEDLKKFKEAHGSLCKLLYAQIVFECPQGKPNLDAICPECIKVLPKVLQGSLGNALERTNECSFPYGMSKDLQDKIRFHTVGCREWERKNISAVCGCGGTHWCICGYNYGYCVDYGDGKCPFCGRRLETRPSTPVVVLPDLANSGITF